MQFNATQADLRTELQNHGVVFLKTVIDVESVLRWQQIANQAWQRFDAIAEKHGPGAIQKILPVGQKYIPTASSFTLEAFFANDQCSQVLQTLANGPTRGLIQDVLEGPVACDLDQAWVRRQFAPMHYPPQHAPHTWHQDGALAGRFTVAAPGAADFNTLLHMVTCWIPLVACGTNAPGLEIITQRNEQLLSPACLVDDFIQSNYPSASFLKPVMEPGDLLLFHGDVLHRTHVDPVMQSDRTSIELRFFPADRIPARLSGDRFVPMVSSDNPNPL
ncbi:MAG: hypothetical protein JWR26_3732 [Pedosphaera sp.]|nr:hypothetical protein [Pedosphaera sp.]